MTDKLSKSKLKPISDIGKLASWYPPVAGLLGILDFFVGSEKSPRLAGFNSEYEFEVNGTLITPTNYAPTAIYTPGSFFDVNNPESLRPVYDNPLGLFTLLETPIVEEHKIVLYHPTHPFHELLWSESYRLSSNIKYVFNKDAGITGVTKLSAALVWTDCPKEDGSTFSTPFFDIECLDDFVVSVDKSLYPESPLVETHLVRPCHDDPKLQIIAVLDDGSGGEIMYTALYEVQLVESADELTVTDPNTFECEAPVPSPVTDFELRGFCATKYDPSLAGLESPPSNPISTSFLNKSDIITNPDIHVFPNPFVNYFSFKIGEHLADQDLELSLINVHGQVVWQESIRHAIQGYYTFTDNIADLPSGSYFLTVKGPSTNEQHSLIKK